MGRNTNKQKEKMCIWSKGLLGWKWEIKRGKKGLEMPGILLGWEVTEKQEVHMGRAVVFLVPTMFSWKKCGDNKERSPNKPCLEILILGSSEDDFLSSEMYRWLENSSTGCMASGILKEGDGNWNGIGLAEVLRFLWKEREEAGKQYVGCGGWKADSLS